MTAATSLATAALDAARATTPCAADSGTVYLLHFDRPYQHASHYTGWALDLDHRLAEHAAGRGARLLAVIKAAGIGWQLARTWPGTRNRERALKRQGGASRRCPLCGIHPQPPRRHTA
jgi:predicted GIY-YIG superfamily endonuclease